MSEQKGWYYQENGVGIYRAFILGGCIRSLTAARMGEDAFPNHFLRPHLDASSSLEDAIIARVEDDTADKVIWRQKTVELPLDIICEGPDGKFNVKVIVRGHIDGLRQQKDCVIDAKAMGPTNFAKMDEAGGDVVASLDALGQIGRQYRWQGAIYGHATDRMMQFAIGEKLKRQDESFYIGKLILEPPVSPSSLVPLEDIERKIRTIEEYAAMDELPECDAGCREGDPYSEVHMFASKPYTRHDDDSELAKMCHEHRYLSAKIAELSARKDDITDRIKMEYGVGDHMAGGFVAQVVHVNGTRFDSKAFKRQHRELYEAFTVPSPSVRLTVKEVGGILDKEETK